VATKPKNMSDEKWEAHVEASRAEHERKAAVEVNPTAAILDLQERVAALERSKSAPKAPKATPKVR
jgi:peptidyl-tRNA hydrolase